MQNKRFIVLTLVVLTTVSVLLAGCRFKLPEAKLTGQSNLEQISETIPNHRPIVDLTNMYEPALPGYSFTFPRDHASHPTYKTEWWYYTGHLETEDHRPFGYELTFFRVGVPLRDPPLHTDWALQTLYAAHFAISDEQGKQFHVAEKLNRRHVGAAGAAENRYWVFNEDWSVIQPKADRGQFHLKADNDQYKIDLWLSAQKPVVIHGQDGVSQKADCKGCASHYYSYTRLATVGKLWINGKPQTVNGLSWMDHEFGSNQLTEKQVGWDWFSIQLADNTEVMLYVLRNQDKSPQSIDPNSSATMIDGNGKTKHLTAQQFSITSNKTWKSDKTQGLYPMGWEINIPSEKLKLTLTPTFEGQELVTNRSTQVAYWEGSTKVEGKRDLAPISGKAYVEMTGYAEKFRQKL